MIIVRSEYQTYKCTTDKSPEIAKKSKKPDLVDCLIDVGGGELTGFLTVTGK